MYPNPQAALPLPVAPSIEQYRKLAKDLVKACKSQEASAISDWALRWVQTLTSHCQTEAVRKLGDIRDDAAELSEFAQTRMSGERTSRHCALADAQFVIARAHGFLSWPKFAAHLADLGGTETAVGTFESAVQSIVTGDAAALRDLLRRRPELVKARSTREHRGTLLHYVSANGVEGYRQVSPKNAAEIAEILLAAGADIEAEADVYGGGCTALGLVATSAPPAIAGVQIDVIDVLLRHGARMNTQSAGNRHSLVDACLANGQPRAAAYLAQRGAPLDLKGAAGVGRLERVRQLVPENHDLRGSSLTQDLKTAFSLACSYGRVEVVQYFLDRGMAADTPLKDHGDGHTGLHVAAYGGHAEVVRLLLRQGAQVDVIDATWGTTPLLWALTGWSNHGAGDREDRYYEVVEMLLRAGAAVRPDVFEWDKVRDDSRMLAVLTRNETQPND